MNTQNILATFVVSSLLAALSGCVELLSPINTPEDLIFDEAVLGVWSEKESRETWVFTRAGKDVYRLVCTDEDGRSGKFVAHLARIQGQLFLDVFPEQLSLPQSAYYTDRFRPTHTIAWVAQIQPLARVSFLEETWLTDFLQKNPGAIPHADVDGRTVLTATPREMQNFLVAHLKTPGAFGLPIEFERRTDRR